MAGVCVPASGISRSTNDTLGVNPAPPNSAAAPDRVPFGGPAPAAPRFSATRCVALLEPKGTRPGERQNVGRLASECSENQSARSEPAHARRLCHGLLATAHVRRWGSCGGVHVARGPPGAFSVPCKSFTRVSRLGQRPWHARHQECEIGRVALLPRHTSISGESDVLCRWHGASAKAQVARKSRVARMAQRHRFEQVNARISTALHRGSASHGYQ